MNNQIPACFIGAMLFALPVSATVVLEYTGATDYVTTLRYFQNRAVASGSGPYVFTRNFSDSSPLSPTVSGTNIYNGPVFYGGYVFSSSALNSGLSAEYIRNDLSISGTTYDPVFLQAQHTGGWAGSTLSLHGLYVFKQENFTTGFETGSFSLDGLSVLWNGYGPGTGSEYDGAGRFLVQKDGNYYVSQTTFDLSKNGSLSLADAGLAAELWAQYDPIASLDFDQSSASFANLSLTDITAAGIYFEDDSWNGLSTSNSAFGLGIANFSISGSVAAVPEPSTTALIAAGLSGLAALAIRRRK